MIIFFNFKIIYLCNFFFVVICYFSMTKGSINKRRSNRSPTFLNKEGNIVGIYFILNSFVMHVLNV